MHFLAAWKCEASWW